MNNLFRTMIVFCALVVGASLQMNAQNMTVSGTVVEETDSGLAPIAGVGVLIKGNPSGGTVTDEKGRYSIAVPSGKPTTLVFTCIGYADQEIAVNGRAVIDVTMAFASEFLDDVVVVGYGVQKRSDVAGSVASIKADDLITYPSNSIAEMMRGKAAGVQVSTSSGAPGSNSSIQIRGVRSLNDGSNTPMFVIDGVVATETEFNAVNPDDVESLEILKDAASQAIYGARAANGVVIITTKRGSKEKPVITFSSTISEQHLWRNFDFYNGDEYYNLRQEAIAADMGLGYEPADYPTELATLGPDTVLGDTSLEAAHEKGQTTNWEDLMFSNALMQKYELGIRGGSNKVRVSASAGWLNQKGMVNIGSRYKRANLRLNMDYEATSWLTIGASSSYIKSSNLGAPASFNSYITLTPLGNPYEEDGVTYRRYVDNGTTQNPLFNAQYYKSETDTDISRLNGYVDIHPFKGFSYKLNAGYYNRYQEAGSYKTREYTGGGAAGSVTGSKLFHYTVENILSYQVPFTNKDLSLNLTGVQSYEYQVSSSIGFGSNTVPVDSFWWNMIADGVNTSMTRSVSEYYLLSYLARAQFSYKGRYLMNVAMRRDGSSRFGKTHKWGNFPSVSLAWRVSQEPWMKSVDAVSNLKLRASYGLVGNQNGIGNYETLGTVSDYEYEFGDNYYMGYLPGSTLANKNLMWESTASANFGIDFGFFKNRINGTIEYYNTTTSNLLFDRSINSVLGYTKMTDNVAKTRTNGIDLNIDFAIVRNKNVEWTTGIVYSLFKNKILRLSGEVDEDGNPVNDVTNKWFVGSPINVIYTYKTNGIFQYDDFEGYDASGKWILKNTEDTDGDGIADAPMGRTDTPIAPGKIKIVDVNGDHKIDADDRVIYKKDPDFIASWNNTLRVYNFDLYMDWYAVVGGYKTNSYLHESNYGGSLQGKNNGIKVDYWTPLNPSNSYPRPSFGTNTSYQSSLTLTKASYLRLRTLSLGYNIAPKALHKIGIQAAKLTLTATNLLTFTDYLSYSPETSPGTYPEARQYAAGINFSF